VQLLDGRIVEDAKRSKLDFHGLIPLGAPAPPLQARQADRGSSGRRLALRVRPLRVDAPRA
jgi:hypothetical protein